MNKVVINGTDGKSYFGEVSEHYKEQLLSEAPGLVELQNAWQYLAMDQHIADPRSGELKGYSRKHMVMPIGAAEGQKEGFFVAVGSWYPLTEEEEHMFEKMVKMAEDATTKLRAANAGIVQPGPGVVAGLRHAAEKMNEK